MERIQLKLSICERRNVLKSLVLCRIPAAVVVTVSYIANSFDVSCDVALWRSN